MYNKDLHFLEDIAFFFIIIITPVFGMKTVLMNAPPVTIQKVPFAEFNCGYQMDAIHSLRASRIVGAFLY